MEKRNQAQRLEKCSYRGGREGQSSARARLRDRTITCGGQAAVTLCWPIRRGLRAARLESSARALAALAPNPHRCPELRSDSHAGTAWRVERGCSGCRPADPSHRRVWVRPWTPTYEPKLSKAPPTVAAAWSFSSPTSRPTTSPSRASTTPPSSPRQLHRPRPIQRPARPPTFGFSSGG